MGKIGVRTMGKMGGRPQGYALTMMRLVLPGTVSWS